MNLLDTIIIAIIIFLILKGFLRGFVRELASLGGVVLGIWLAKHFQPQMTNFLETYLSSSRYIPLISFAVIFASVLLVANLLGWIVSLSLKKVVFGWPDRTLGAGVATIKGVIVIYLLIVVLTFFVSDRTPLIAKSKLAPLIIRSYQSVIRLVSSDQSQNWNKKSMGDAGDKGEVVSEKTKYPTEENG